MANVTGADKCNGDAGVQFGSVSPAGVNILLTKRDNHQGVPLYLPYVVV